MKIKNVLVASLAAVGFAGYGAVAHADAAAAKKLSIPVCAERPEGPHFEGGKAADLAATIKKISAGQMKHKKAIKLTDQEAADMAAFMAGGAK